MEVIIWELVEATGWTLDYIDSLPVDELSNWLRIQDARAKAQRARAKK